MKLTEEAVNEFKAIYEAEFGEPCTAEQAHEMARRILQFFDAYAAWRRSSVMRNSSEFR